MFLEPAELRTLTGYAQRSKQVAQLRLMGIPFHINAAGRPVVARAIIEGGKQKQEVKSTWTPSWAAAPR